MAAASFKPGYFELLQEVKTRNLIKERLFLKAEEDIRQKDPFKNESFVPPKNILQVIEKHFGKVPPTSEDDQKFDSLTLEFAQEKLLQEFIVNRWDEIPEFHNKNLQIYGGSNIGVEYNTQTVGRIDILAEEKDRQNFTVIELKKGLGGDRHLGQLLRYMGWVRSQLSEGRAVFGLLIASKFKESTRYAIQELQTISLMEYELLFQLHPITL